MTEPPVNEPPDSGDDSFDELGRRAGAALRRPAPARGVSEIARRGRREQLVRAAVAVGAVMCVVVGGIVLLSRDDNATTITPVVDTTPETTTPPTNVVATTLVPAPESTAPEVVPTTIPDTTDPTGGVRAELVGPLIGADIPADTVPRFLLDLEGWDLIDAQFMASVGDPVDAFTVVGSGPLWDAQRATAWLGPSARLSPVVAAVPVTVADAQGRAKVELFGGVDVVQIEWPMPDGTYAGLRTVGIGLDEALVLAESVQVGGSGLTLDVPTGFEQLATGEPPTQATDQMLSFTDGQRTMSVVCTNNLLKGLVNTFVELPTVSREVNGVDVGVPLVASIVGQQTPGALEATRWFSGDWMCQLMRQSTYLPGDNYTEEELIDFLSSLTLVDEATFNDATPGDRVIIDEVPRAPVAIDSLGPLIGADIPADTVPLFLVDVDGWTMESFHSEAITGYSDSVIVVGEGPLWDAQRVVVSFRPGAILSEFEGEPSPSIAVDVGGVAGRGTDAMVGGVDTATVEWPLPNGRYVRMQSVGLDFDETLAMAQTVGVGEQGPTLTPPDGFEVLDVGDVGSRPTDVIATFTDGEHTFAVACANEPNFLANLISVPTEIRAVLHDTEVGFRLGPYEPWVQWLRGSWACSQSWLGPLTPQGSADGEILEFLQAVVLVDETTFAEASVGADVTINGVEQ